MCNANQPELTNMRRKGIFLQSSKAWTVAGKPPKQQSSTGRLYHSHNAMLTLRAQPTAKSAPSFAKCCLYTEKNDYQPKPKHCLFAADRVEHVQNEVKPAVRRGQDGDL